MSPLNVVAERVKEIASRLDRAHAHRERFTVLPELATDLELAYAVQEELVRRWSAAGQGAVVGWKIGLTSPRMQAMCGIQQPIAGAVLSGRVHETGVAIRCNDFVRLGIECELAVRMAKPLPLDEPYDPVRVLGCVDSVCAAFELVEDRGADYTTLNAASMVADNSWNGGVVLGPPAPATAFSTLLGLHGRLVVNGELVDEGDSDSVAGNPLRVVDWLARSLASRDRALEPGQYVMTGSIVTTKFPRAGDRFRFELDRLAPVEIVAV